MRTHNKLLLGQVNKYLVGLQQVNIAIYLSFSCLTRPAGIAKAYLKGCVDDVTLSFVSRGVPQVTLLKAVSPSLTILPTPL